MAFLSAPVEMARGAKDQVAHVAEELCCNAKRPKYFNTCNTVDFRNFIVLFWAETLAH